MQVQGIFEFDEKLRVLALFRRYSEKSWDKVGNGAHSQLAAQSLLPASRIRKKVSSALLCDLGSEVFCLLRDYFRCGHGNAGEDIMQLCGWACVRLAGRSGSRIAELQGGGACITLFTGCRKRRRKEDGYENRKDKDRIY